MSIECLTIDATFRAIKEKLSRVMPDFEIQQKAELVFAINRLKRERGAIILGHNHMESVLYLTIPDVVGNSPALAKNRITDRPGRDCFLRRPIHGGDSKNTKPEKNRAVTHTAVWLLPGGEHYR